MKIKLIIFITAVLTMIGFSCSDSFLDTQPFGAVTQTTLTSNEKGADALLIAAYSNLDGFSGWDNSNPWGGAASNWTFGSIAGGDAYKGSEANDQPDITPIERHETTGTNPYVEGKWYNYYDGIARANDAIKAFIALDAKLITEERRNIRLGEARFLRAFYHFELRKVFGKVPYITEDLKDVRIGNTNDILPQIQLDFSFAKDNLPLTQPEPGRATKGAAQSLLGITYMWEEKYALAKTEFDAVRTSGVYELNSGYHQNFNAEFRNTKESILEVQQSVNDGSTDNANNGDVLNFPYGGGPGGCCGFHQPSQNLVNAFRTDPSGLPYLDTYNDTDVKNDDGVSSFTLPTTTGHTVGETISDNFVPETASLDPRLDWTVGRRGVPYLDWGIHPGKPWIRDQLYGGPYAPKKNVYYKAQENTYTAASGWTKGYNSNNTKLLRFSDLLLFLAEAEVELGNLGTALNYVNQIRARAANPAGFPRGLYQGQLKVTEVDGAGKIVSAEPIINATAPSANYNVQQYASFPDQAFARKAVRFERRLELGMEGHRFFDLVRWDVAKAEKNAYFAKEKLKRTYLVGATFEDSDYVFPIPTQAITLSSINGQPTLVQNPGY